MAEKNEIERLKCMKCITGNNHSEATVFCADCAEYKCESCCLMHKEDPGTSSHVILRCDLHNDFSAFQHIKELSHCLIHRETKVTHYCADHNLYICALCSVDEHRLCGRIFGLSDLPTGSIPENALEKVISLQRRTKSVEDSQKKYVEDLEVGKNQIRSEIEEFAGKLIEEIVQMKENAVNELDNLTEAETMNVRIDMEESNTYVAECKKYRDIVETINKYGIKGHGGNLGQILFQKISAMEQSLEKQQPKQPAQLHFTKNHMLSLITRLGTVHKLGESQTQEEEDTFNMDRQECVENASQCRSSNFAVRDRTKNVRIKDDQNDCSILACVVFNDGTVLLIDGENKKLKAFSHEFKFIDAVRFNSSPTDLCRIGKSKVAVIYKDLKRIDQYSTRNRKLSYWYGMQTRYNNIRITDNKSYEQFGLLCKADNAMYGRIQIREYDGMVLLDIGLECFASPAELTVDESYICYTADGLMLVSKNIGVWCMQLIRNFEDLKIKWKVPLDAGIQSIDQVSCDRNARLYICSTSSQSIYQIDRHHTKILVSDISVPISCVVDTSRERIILGCHKDSYMHIFSTATSD